ncbi:TadE/TadG family protein [Tardiphaga alba]|uniref:TadE/TadG family protein n=1 Tax=Tardiphaga alba TaxID=340268 RepID=A0ABX8ABQ4_9BRAD|nr:pilus assembly protein [Tardiphaga alba]QUS40391.1 TadE/TadG family protein [Tardiphaga alba]
MSIRSISDQASRAAKRFRSDERGNVAMIFAVSLVPLLGFVGAAVDYSRTNAARTTMQVALDSAALMVSKDLGSNPTMSAAEVSAKAVKYFNALYTNSSSSPIAVTASYTTNTKDGSTVTLNGSGNVATDFMKMVGFPQMNILGSSTTTWGSTRMRIAVALDVTGSMNSSGKLAAMKTAAKNLIDTLSASSRMTEDVYISIVPFAQMVNVGKSNKDASWLKWDDWDSSNGSWTWKNGSWNWTSSSRNNWNGCVTDRDQPYDTTNDAATSSATRYPANQYNACPEAILGMTSAYGSSNVQTLKNKIDALDANGGTNQPIGMAWAWQTLQIGTDPFPAPAKDSNYKYTDAIILLSDGMNTIDRWYGNGSTWSTQVDGRQKLLCDNIKAPVNGKQQTIIYTIQVNTDGDPESAILKYCADSGNFYPTSTASGIATAFTAIGNSLNKLRVSR